MVPDEQENYLQLVAVIIILGTVIDISFAIDRVINIIIISIFVIAIIIMIVIVVVLLMLSCIITILIAVPVIILVSIAMIPSPLFTFLWFINVWPAISLFLSLRACY